MLSCIIGYKTVQMVISTFVFYSFSVVDRQSLDDVRDFWIPEIREVIGQENAKILLVGTKSDLRDKQENVGREVTQH